MQRIEGNEIEFMNPEETEIYYEEQGL